MAQVNFRVTLGLVDAAGIPAQFQFYGFMDDSQSVADVEVYAHAVAADIDNATAAQVTSCTCNLDVPIGDLKPAALAGVGIEQTGLLGFIPSGDTRTFGVPIPALLNSLIVGGTVDLTAGPIVAIVNGWTTPDATINPATFDFVSLVGGALTRSGLSFRQRSSFRHRASFNAVG